MSIAFASGDTLTKKKEDENEFSFFKGIHPSTLQDQDVYLMQLERQKFNARIHGPQPTSQKTERQHPYPRYDSRNKQSATRPLPRRVGDDDSTRLPKQQQPQRKLDSYTSPVHGKKKALTYEDLSEAEKMMLVEKTFSALIAKLKTSKTCFYCKKSFCDYESICKRKCVWHPGKQIDGRWTCCPQKADVVEEFRNRATGCSSCDHTEEEYDPLRKNTVEVPLGLAHMMGIRVEEMLYMDPNKQESALRRKCIILKATNIRVENPKMFKMPLNYVNIPPGDMTTLRDKLELRQRQTKAPNHFWIDTYAGPYTSGLHLTTWM